MRRWLLVFLMAILPLQLSWAAVARCCQHEPAQVVHFGDHEREVHDEGAVARDPHVKKSLLTVDDDCGSCQLCHAQVLAPPTLPPRVALQPTLRGLHISALPERPDRRLA
jgi:hypothetical protein